MIRTLIEADGKDDHEFKRNLESALDKLGFERKPDPDDARWTHDMYAALHEMGMDLPLLVESYRKKHFGEKL